MSLFHKIPKEVVELVFMSIPDVVVRAKLSLCCRAQRNSFAGASTPPALSFWDKQFASMFNRSYHDIIDRTFLAELFRFDVSRANWKAHVNSLSPWGEKPGPQLKPFSVSLFGDVLFANVKSFWISVLRRWQSHSTVRIDPNASATRLLHYAHSASSMYHTVVFTIQPEAEGFVFLWNDKRVPLHPRPSWPEKGQPKFELMRMGWEMQGAGLDHSWHLFLNGELEQQHTTMPNTVKTKKLPVLMAELNELCKQFRVQIPIEGTSGIPQIDPAPTQGKSSPGFVEETCAAM